MVLNSAKVAVAPKRPTMSVVGEGLIFFLKALLLFFVVIHNSFQGYFFSRSALNFLLIIIFYLPYKENYFFVKKNMTQKCQRLKNIDQSTQNF